MPLPNDFTVLPTVSPLLRELILAEQHGTGAELEALRLAAKPILDRIEAGVIRELAA